MTLFHISENPNLSEFIPLPAPNPDAGVEGNAVWAIHESELANYLLPRDCPRICYRDNEGKKTIAIESGWLDRIKATILYVYRFDSQGFQEIDSIAGYWISRNAVQAMEKITVDNILEKLQSLELELKVLPHLHDERNFVLQNYTHFSIIRFRNACEPSNTKI